MTPKLKRKIKTQEEFAEFSKNFQKEHQMPYAFGIGINYQDSKNENTLAIKWLTVNVENNMGAASALMDFFDIDLGSNLHYYKEFTWQDAKALLKAYFQPFISDGKYHENVESLKQLQNYSLHPTEECSVVFYTEKAFFDTKIVGIGDAHFRLALLSRLKFKPNTISLEGLFDTLPTLAWAEDGVYTPEEWNKKEWMARNNASDVLIDKIPLLGWGVPIPSGVRMPNPKSARLGAYLSPGTTIMHYGFVNFNAGTLGNAMVEGTIAAGVTVDDGIDIGKGGGFLGTLSGGNKVKISTGKNCLIGALAECGIPLGDNCVVATGVCFTANTPFVEILEGSPEVEYKAIHFKGKNNLTFRRHAVTGRLEVIHKGNKSELNEELHAKEKATAGA